MRGGWSERFAGRVMTRFEQRGIDAGRTIRDLRVVRTEHPWEPARAETALSRLERGAAMRPAPRLIWERPDQGAHEGEGEPGRGRRA